jgi:hypothetical protein
VLNGVTATTTDADHLDDRTVPFFINDLKHTSAPLQGKQNIKNCKKLLRNLNTQYSTLNSHSNHPPQTTKH